MACFRVNFTITFNLSTKCDYITTTSTTTTAAATTTTTSTIIWSQLSAIVLYERSVIPCFANSKGF